MITTKGTEGTKRMEKGFNRRERKERKGDFCADGGWLSGGANFNLEPRTRMHGSNGAAIKIAPRLH